MDYLIPANTKKGQLILGMFKPFDLILFGTGIGISLLFMMIIPLQSTLVTIIVLLPALVTGFLVVPIPNYHNMLTVISELIEFLSNQRSYEWKGWCIRSDSKKRK
jgi:hypothetical protein